MISRGDTIIIAAAAAVVVFTYLRFWVPPGATAERVVIRGTEIEQTYSLTNDNRVEIAGPLGKTVVEFRDGRVRVAESPCRRKLCVHRGWLERAGEMTFCLPNAVSVELVGDSYYDGITF
ncbi:MAG: NusG domain II-containing protein [Gammaproteobacteria bacterium]